MVIYDRIDEMVKIYLVHPSIKVFFKFNLNLSMQKYPKS